jgi:tight adherence protein B
VLRKAAASLREMARLEGVLRTKTAEGKAQALVISLLPGVLYGGLRLSDEDFFLPLETTASGHVLLGVAAVFWVAAGLLSYKILSVKL